MNNPKLFICYSHDDRPTCEDLADLLREVYGHEQVWFDKNLSGGDIWQQEIFKQIEDSDIFLFLASRESQDSKYCQEELDYALQERKAIIPLKLRASLVPSAKIEVHQMIDFSDWRRTPHQINSLHAAIYKPKTWTHRDIVEVVDASGELTYTKQLQLDYWTAFNQLLKSTNSVVKSRKPHPQHWAEYAVGRSIFYLSAAMNTRSPNINVSLIIANDDAKAYFHLLKQDEEAIEAEIGTKLSWDELPDNKWSYIGLSHKDFDPNNRQTWDQQHAWLKEILEAFYHTFAPRVKDLDLED